jgi:hypothetical protein
LISIFDYHGYSRPGKDVVLAVANRFFVLGQQMGLDRGIDSEFLTVRSTKNPREIYYALPIGNKKLTAVIFSESEQHLIVATDSSVIVYDFIFGRAEIGIDLRGLTSSYPSKPIATGALLEDGRTFVFAYGNSTQFFLQAVDIFSARVSTAIPMGNLGEVTSVTEMPNGTLSVQGNTTLAMDVPHLTNVKVPKTVNRRDVREMFPRFVTRP